MQHHGWVSANLQLSISSWNMVPLQQTLFYTKAPVLRAEGPQGGGLCLSPTPIPSCDYKHTHAYALGISCPTSLPASFNVCICCSFHLQQLHSSSWLICAQFFIIVQSREAGRISEQKPNVPQRPNLSPRLWQFITGSKRYTPLNTHRHIHINRDNTENKQKRSRSIYCNLKCVPSCVVLCLTPTHKNMKRFVCLRRQGKRNPLRSPASGIYGSKNSPILHINQK